MRNRTTFLIFAIFVLIATFLLTVPVLASSPDSSREALLLVPNRIYPADTQVISDVSAGWPRFTFTHDLSADTNVWYQIWIGSADYSTTYHFKWYPAATYQNIPGICDQLLTCTIPVDIWLPNGDYSWWMTYYSQENPDYNNQWTETTFSVNAPAPTTITTRLPDTTVVSASELSWDHDPGTLWYQVWLGAADYSATNVFDWYLASDICTGGTCTLTIDPVLTSPGDFEWWIEAWGPGGYDTWTVNGATNFTVSQVAPQ